MAAKKKTSKAATKESSKASKKKTDLEDIQNFTTGRIEDDTIEKVKKLEEVL